MKCGSHKGLYFVVIWCLWKRYAGIFQMRPTSLVIFPVSLLLLRLSLVLLKRPFCEHPNHIIGSYFSGVFGLKAFPFFYSYSLFSFQLQIIDWYPDFKSQSRTQTNSTREDLESPGKTKMKTKIHKNLFCMWLLSSSIAPWTFHSILSRLLPQFQVCIAISCLFRKTTKCLVNSDLTTNEKSKQNINVMRCSRIKWMYRAHLTTYFTHSSSA